MNTFFPQTEGTTFAFSSFFIIFLWLADIFLFQIRTELNDILNLVAGLLLYLEQEQERRVNMREKTRTRSRRGAYRSIRQAGSHTA